MTTGRKKLPRPQSDCHPDKLAFKSTGGLCVTCYKREWSREKRRRNPVPKKEYKPIMSKCHPDRRHWGKGLCIACYGKEYRKFNPEVNRRATAKWRIKNADAIYNKHLRYRYGISIQTFNELYNQQHKQCKLCKQPLKKEEAVVDHNHTTDKLRGIVHQKCNMLIGWFEASLEYKDQITAYLMECA